MNDTTLERLSAKHPCEKCKGEGTIAMGFRPKAIVRYRKKCDKCDGSGVDWISAYDLAERLLKDIIEKNELLTDELRELRNILSKIKKGE